MIFEMNEIILIDNSRLELQRSITNMNDKN